MLLLHPVQTGTSPSGSVGQCVPAWLKKIKEPLDHSHGFRWPALILPNNFLFFIRDEPQQMHVKSVSSNLHDSYELVIAYEGLGRVCLGETIYPVRPGDAFLVRPGEFHHYFGFESEHFHWLHFKFDLDEQSDILFPGGSVRHLDNGDMEALSAIGSAYVSGELTSALIFRVAAAMAQRIEAMADRPEIAPIGTLHDEAFRPCTVLQTISTFIQNRLDEALRIDDIARHLQISESNLRKLFRESYGTSLGLYLRNSRFGRSAQLIGDPGLSISEIAKRSGFESISSFSQAFRAAFGMTPSLYRRHLENRGQPTFSGGL